MIQNDPISEACSVAGRLSRNLIGGEWIDAESGDTIDVRNPANGEIIGAVPSSSANDVDRAVKAASESFENRDWRGLSADRRSQILWRVAELLEENADHLAHLETLDNGMPLAKARGLAVHSAAKFRYAAGWCTKIQGSAHDLELPHGSFQTYSLKEPIGVAALITPWNVPLALAATKVSSALAAGCSVILKPAEEAPMTALRLGELLVEAGIPAGVVNVVSGYGNVAGAALSSHRLVDKISFTGSTAVGKQIVTAASDNLKRVSLELGGKSPVVVCEDADVAAAAPLIANGVFSNSGQMCVAGSRIFVHRSRHDELVEVMAGIANSLKVGDGFDPSSQLGPIVSERQLNRVMELVSVGVEDGSEIAVGGTRVGTTGYFYSPTILTAPRPDSRIISEEIFGPVGNVIPFEDEEAVVEAANDTVYGLAAAIYSQNGQRAHRLARQIKAGTVWLNTQLALDPSVPFGGFRQSGWGRESGREGIEEYLETKAVIAAL